MAVTNTTRTDTLDEFRQKTNEVSDFVGDKALDTTAITLTDAINEHESDIGNMTLTGLSSTNLSAALRELRVDIGDVGAAGVALNTTATNLASAINEHESDIGNMTLTGLSATNLSAAARELATELGQVTSLTTTTKTSSVAAINELHSDIGTNALVGLTATNLTAAANELRVDIGDVGNAGANLNTTATNLASAINEHESDIGNMALTGLAATNLSAGLREIRVDIGDVGNAGANLNTTATNLTSAINELYADIGDVGNAGANLNTTATNLTSAINEHESDIGNMTLTGLSATNLSAATRELATELGQVTALTTTTKTSSVAAINELHGDIGNAGAAGVNLTTAAKNLVGAINEHESDIGNMTLTGLTATNLSAGLRELRVDIGDVGNAGAALNTTATNLASAINELVATKVNLVSSTTQVLDSDLQLPSGKTFTINGSLDIINGQLNVAAGTGSLNINTSFLSLGAPDADIAPSGGVIINRGDNGTVTTLDDVRLFWDETDEKWKTKSLDNSGSVVNSQIVTRYNAKELFAGNTETNVSVDWDAVSENFDIKLIDEPSVLGITAGSIKIGVGTTAANNQTISTNTSTDLILAPTTAITKVTGSLQTTTSISAGTTLSSGGLATLNSASITNDLTVGGNLTVSGTTTYINTTELNIGDNIFVLNADVVGTPSQNAGMEIERGTASNVSVLWNETNDRWEFVDSSGTYEIFRPGSDTVLSFTDGDTTTITADTNDTIQFIEGSGMDINFTDTTEPGFGLTFTNTDRGSSQAIFKNVAVSGQTTIVADSNNDTLTIANSGGLSITTNATTDTLSIGHSDTSSVATLSSDNSANTFIQDINFTFDTYGHVTGASVGTGTVNTTQFILQDGDTTNVTIDDGNYIKFVEGLGIDINWTDITTGNSTTPFDLTFTNTDRGSSQAIFKNVAVSGQSTIVADSNNDTLTVVGGGAITVTTNATTDTLTVAHTDTSSVANLTPNNSGNTFIQDISLTFDTYGHVTGASAVSATVNQTNFFLEDGDGTEVNITDGAEVKFVEGTGNGASIDINWTDTTPGSDADPFDLTFTVTNTDKGSSQNIFKNFTVDDTDTEYTWATTGTVTADNNNDTVYFVGGTDINIDADTTNDAIRITMNGTYDNYQSWTIKDGDTTTYSITSGDTLQIVGGTALRSNFTADDVLNIYHLDVTRTDTTETAPDGIAVTGVFTNSQGHITGVESYNFDLRYNNYVHPNDGGGDQDTLTDATVYDKIAINAAGHVTGTTTRNLTAANIGALSITGKAADSNLLDGIDSASFLRTTGKAADSNLLDGIDSAAFLRSNVADTKSVGNLTFSDNVALNIGGAGDLSIYCNGNTQGDIHFDALNTNTNQSIVIRDAFTTPVTRFTFGIPTGNFTATGNVTAYSDASLKTKVEKIENALNKVCQISGYTYDRTDIDTSRQTGVIAQEVETVLPEVVHTDEDGIKSVAYGNMVGLLIEAIKDLKAEIEDIKTKI